MCRHHQKVLFQNLILCQCICYFWLISNTGSQEQRENDDEQQKIVQDWRRSLAIFLKKRSKKILSTNMAKLTLEDMCHLHSAFLAQGIQ
uniref:Uncharacterized protein n=1 Tax=Romanomermis culicivorax TaxID=13658 RepID=A0A915JA13_ROMCU